MNRHEFFQRFDLNDHFLLNQQINTVTAIYQMVLVSEGQLLLTLYEQSH